MFTDRFVTNHTFHVLFLPETEMIQLYLLSFVNILLHNYHFLLKYVNLKLLAVLQSITYLDCENFQKMTFPALPSAANSCSTQESLQGDTIPQGVTNTVHVPGIFGSESAALFQSPGRKAYYFLKWVRGRKGKGMWFELPLSVSFWSYPNMHVF